MATDYKSKPRNVGGFEKMLRYLTGNRRPQYSREGQLYNAGITEVKPTGVRKPPYQGANTLSEVKVTGQRKSAYKAPAPKTSTPVQGGGAQRASSGSQKATGGSQAPTRRSKSMEGKSLADFLGLGADSAVRRSMGRRAEMRSQVAQRKGKK